MDVNAHLTANARHALIHNRQVRSLSVLYINTAGRSTTACAVLTPFSSTDILDGITAPVSVSEVLL